MTGVSALATAFGFLGILPFLLLGLALALLTAGGLATGLPPAYAASVGLIAVAGVVLCFLLSAGYLLAWGVLRALCQIHAEMQAARWHVEEAARRATRE